MVWFFTFFAMLLVIGYHTEGPIRSVLIWISAIAVGLYHASYTAGLGVFIGLSILLFPLLLLYSIGGFFLGKWLTKYD
jgi:hypothetical protein